MRLSRTLPLLALLILAPASVFAVALNQTLIINITMQIDANMRIEWAAGTNVTLPRAWSNLAADIDSAYTSVGVVTDALFPLVPIPGGLNVINRSNVKVNVTAAVTDQGLVWIYDTILAAPHADDVYHILASTNGGAIAPTVNAAHLVTPNSYAIGLPMPVGTAVTITGAALTRNSVQGLELAYITPLNVTNAGPNTTQITLTATP
jgi:hypothetical protein